MRLLVTALLLSVMAPAFGQSFYKCPSLTPGAPPVIQQMPCSPTGGGETITVKVIHPAETGGIRISEMEFSILLNKKWDEEAEKAWIESGRWPTH